jgi:long-chain acyl-CoA synthetase
MNVKYLINRAVRQYPNNLALVYGEKRLTFLQLNDRVNRLANALIKQGLKKGDRIGILMKNSTYFIEFDFALPKIGAVRVPLNMRLSDQDHEYMLNDSEASTLIFEAEFTEIVARTRPNLKTVTEFIRVSNGKSGTAPAGMLDYEDFIAGSSEEEPPSHIDDNDLHTIFYTSGTTGKPKGVMLTQKSWANVAVNLILDYGPVTEQDVLLNLQPLSHGAGFFVLPFFMAGATNVLVPRFDAALILKTIEKEKVTVLKLVPTMLYQLMESEEKLYHDLSSLHSIIYGGSPIVVNKLIEAVKFFGSKLVQLYGQAEAPMCISTLSKKDHIIEGPELLTKRLSSAGQPLTNVEVKIVDDDGREVLDGDVGEVLVKGDHIMKGYWKKPDETAETLRNGWIHTGDLGFSDPNGYIFLVDRKRDVIISGGFNIYSREIEDTISLHPKVQDVAVVGVPDEKWGEAVKALIIPKAGVELEKNEIIDFCRTRLASFKKPKTVEIVQSLPYNPYGKIQKSVIKERYWKGYDRRIH